MRAGPAVLVDAAVWAGWGTAVGYVAARLPDERFAADGPVTRIRAWERDGRAWERTRVRSWKDGLPELGSLFGGRSKRRLAASGWRGLEELAIETRRAETVHWAAALPAAVMPLWNPRWVSAIMAGYAVAANAPFIVVQRYNRARIQRIQRARRARPAARSARVPIEVLAG
jgi:glycosyl-4,4'-diaponeurosporenoate acyltransferase